MLKLLGLLLSTVEYRENLRERSYNTITETSLFFKLPQAVREHLMVKELGRNGSSSLCFLIDFQWPRDQMMESLLEKLFLSTGLDFFGEIQGSGMVGQKLALHDLVKVA